MLARRRCVELYQETQHWYEGGYAQNIFSVPDNGQYF